MLNPDGTVSTAYNTSTGVGLYADLNLETVTVNANKPSTTNNIVSQIEQQITQSVNTAQAQLQSSLLAMAAWSDQAVAVAGTLEASTGKAVFKAAGAAASVAAAVYDIANGESRGVVAGDFAVGAGAYLLGGWPGVGLGLGWAGLKSYPGGPGAFLNDTFTGYGTACSADPGVCN